MICGPNYFNEGECTSYFALRLSELGVSPLWITFRYGNSSSDLIVTPGPDVVSSDFLGLGVKEMFRRKLGDIGAKGDECLHFRGHPEQAVAVMPPSRVDRHRSDLVQGVRVISIDPRGRTRRYRSAG